MVSGLQPRRRDAAKTNRFLCKECRNCNTVGLQTAVGYFLFRWRQSRALGLYLSVTGPETALATFRSTEGKAGPKGSMLRVVKLPLATFRLAEGKAGPKDFVTLCVPGLETAVGRCSFHWRHGLAQESVCSGSCNCRWAPSFFEGTGPETAVGHLSFDWGVKPAPRSRSAEGKAGPTEWRMTACCSTEGTAGPKESIRCGSWNCHRAPGLYAYFIPLRARLGPKSQSVTGPQTAVVPPMAHWRHSRGPAVGRWPFFVPLRANRAQLESICCGSWNCRWAPFVLLKTKLGPRTLHFSLLTVHNTLRSTEGTAGPKESICYGSWNCRWQPLVPLRAKPGPQTLHFSFHWGHGLAQAVCLFGVLQLPLGTCRSLRARLGLVV